MKVSTESQVGMYVAMEPQVSTEPRALKLPSYLSGFLELRAGGVAKGTSEQRKESKGTRKIAKGEELAQTGPLPGAALCPKSFPFLVFLSPFT